MPTNTVVAGLSTATSLGANFVAPVPVPRLPIGLGGLSVEAEATTRDGKQVGAMVWAKGANFVTTSARVSQIGDAYSLAASFGSDFSRMLVSGKTPFKGLPKIPSGQRIKSGLGGKPKYPACEKFGRSAGRPVWWTLQPLRSGCRPPGPTSSLRRRTDDHIARQQKTPGAKLREFMDLVAGAGFEPAAFRL
nr:DUF3313 family protein [Neorhizobium tomejilense]